MSSLEDRVAALEQTVSEQSALGAQQDSDLSGLTQGLRAANNLLQALALTQSDQSAILAEHTLTLAKHTQSLAELSAGVQTIIRMIAAITPDGDGEQSV